MGSSVGCGVVVVATTGVVVGGLTTGGVGDTGLMWENTTSTCKLSTQRKCPLQYSSTVSQCY